MLTTQPPTQPSNRRYRCWVVCNYFSTQSELEYSRILTSATSGRETSSPHPQVSHPQPVEWHHGRPRTCIAPISLTTKVLQRSLLPPAHYWAIGAPVGGHSYSSAANGVKAGNTWIEVTWRYPSGGWVRSRIHKASRIAQPPQPNSFSVPHGVNT